MPDPRSASCSMSAYFPKLWLRIAAIRLAYCECPVDQCMRGQVLTAVWLACAASGLQHNSTKFAEVAAAVPSFPGIAEHRGKAAYCCDNSSTQRCLGAIEPLQPKYVEENHHSAYLLTGATGGKWFKSFCESEVLGCSQCSGKDCERCVGQPQVVMRLVVPICQKLNTVEVVEVYVGRGSWLPNKSPVRAAWCTLVGSTQARELSRRRNHK